MALPAHWLRVHAFYLIFRCKFCSALFSADEGHDCSHDAPEMARLRIHLVGKRPPLERPA